LVENFVPGFAAIGGAEDAALAVRAIGVAKCSHKNDVWVLGIDDDLANGTGVFQADVGPGLAAVQRLVNAIALSEVAANAGFARAYVKDVGVGLGHGDAADGGGALMVEDGFPAQRAVGGFPDAASGGAEIVSARVAGHAHRGERTSATVGANHAITHALFFFFFLFLGLRFFSRRSVLGRSFSGFFAALL